MKTLKLFLCTVLLILASGFLKSNPVTPAGLIVEIYFEDGQWVMVADNTYLWIYGLNSFDNIMIFSQSGSSSFQPDFLPDMEEAVTLITNDALFQPIEVDPTEDQVGARVDEGYSLAFLDWGPDPGDMVSGPAPGQSLVLSMVAYNMNYNYIYWTVKGESRDCFENSCWKWGTFTGSVVDQSGNPVQGAEICYLCDELLFSGYTFTHLVTGADGNYEFGYMPARNYHIEKIMIDGAEYLTDEYITIEPNQTTTLDFTVILTGAEEHSSQRGISLSNYPNPFRGKTNFSIFIPENNFNQAMVIRVADISGKVIGIIPVDTSASKDGKMSITWNPGETVAPGVYFASLIAVNRTLVVHKITIE